jgi:hypothetical protein
MQAAEVISVVERPSNETNIDIQPKGDSRGDLLVFANVVYDAANHVAVGSDQGFCVRVNPGKSWECQFTMMLKEGQIMTHGPFYDSGDSAFAIVGGTGKYAGAKGVMKLHPRDAKVTSYDFRYELQ